jgi:hypothetical protein
VHVQALRFSLDGTLLAAGGQPNTDVFVWDTATGQLVQRLVGPAANQIDQSRGIGSLAWATSQNRLAFGNSDGDILLWDVGSGEQVDTLETNSAISGLSFVAHSEDRWLISGQWNGRLKVWDLSLGHSVQDLDVGARIHDVDVRGDGLQLAAGGGATGNRGQGGLGFVRVWKVQRNGDTLELCDERLLSGPRDVVRSLQYTSDGRRLLAGGWDGAVHLWDVTEDLTVARRRQLLVLDAEIGNIEAVRATRDGIRLAAAGEDDKIRIWDAFDGYTSELSPLLLPILQRRVMAGTSTEKDHRLRAQILARQGNWSAAAADFDRLFQLHKGARW